jgi:tRNA threonylcarbamoyladenosine modification (KEOPS) complex  Pcc1 subunit
LDHAPLKAELKLDLESKEKASIIYLAIDPETKEVSSDRARTTVKQEANVIRMLIEAEDLTALRASINSFLAWISACERTLETLSQYE